MCGIAGSINFPFPEKAIFNAMHHRGPDDSGLYRHTNIQFFHLRLSILDIACGQQPMHLGEKYTIIFNGEIFNHNEIRQQFNLNGKTSSDTETLLLLYEKFGTEFLNYLDGMFVFAIHDKTNNTVFIARDRAGVKPLYYFTDGSKFVFASELNGLRSMVSLEMEPNHFFSYLRLGSFFNQYTPYKNVTEVEPGSFLLLDCNNLSIKKTKWWNIHKFYLQNCNDTFEEALTRTDEILHSSVKRRLETSDLEVGAFLSGGIDSGLITAVAQQYNSKIKTFTVSFDGEYDEAPLAKLVAEKYGTKHHEIKISFDHLQQDIEKILINYGEPFFDSSAIPGYYVSKAAKEFVTVILNGDGADELFGGYRRYVPFAKIDFFQKHFFRQFVNKNLQLVLPPGHQKKSIYNYLYRLTNLASKSGVDTYLAAGVDIFEGFTDQILGSEDDYMADLKIFFDTINNSKISGLRKLMNLDFDINLAGDLLVKMDIATMANSQEGRSPFLCKEFLEYIPAISDSYKINRGQTKVLLRKLAEKYLPAQLINQPKRGFEIPLKKWVNEDLNAIIFDYLNCADNVYSTFVNKQFVSDLMKNKVKISAEKRSKILWTLFSLEVWYKNVQKK